MTDFDPFIKVVVVGDKGVGKSWFVSYLINEKSPSKNTASSLFDSQVKQVEVDGIEYEVTIWDTPGGEEMKKLRCHAYPETDVILLCYSVDDQVSFHNVARKWLPELKRHCRGVPKILLGLKSDLKRNSLKPTVSEKEGEIMQLHINATAFYEYSIGQNKKLNTIFSKVVRMGMRKKMTAYRKSCSIQ